MDSIKVKENNLYSKGSIAEFADGHKSLDREKLVYSATSRDIYHIVTSDDELDALAYRYYKNSVQDPSKYWWVIADVNNIEDPTDITSLIGTEILVPDILNVRLRI